MNIGKIKRISFFLLVLIAIILPAKYLFAQGNIFGNVTNSNASTPVNGEMTFFGYIEGSDEELKIESCVGCGYDAGNWFDVLPNYLTVSVNDQFDYHFYNVQNGENVVLSGIIDTGGFQQEDIDLLSLALPEKPSNLIGVAVSGQAVEINWTTVTGLTYHIYRRDASSNGSFFRIDDPTGSLSNPGVSESPFIDNTVDGTNTYNYLIIAENGSGEFSPHSDYLVQSSSAFTCGDINNDGGLNILDVIYFINFKYKGGPEPESMASAEVNGDGSLNILDVIYFINFKYKGGPDLQCPDYFEYP